MCSHRGIGLITNAFIIIIIHLTQQCFLSTGKDLPWNFIHGLYEFAIYGGRVDNPFDLRVLVSYLRQFFESGVINAQGKNKRLGPLRMPTSTNIRVRTNAWGPAYAHLYKQGRLAWRG